MLRFGGGGEQKWKPVLPAIKLWCLYSINFHTSQGLQFVSDLHLLQWCECYWRRNGIGLPEVWTPHDSHENVIFFFLHVDMFQEHLSDHTSNLINTTVTLRGIQPLQCHSHSLKVQQKCPPDKKAQTQSILHHIHTRTQKFKCCRCEKALFCWGGNNK